MLKSRLLLLLAGAAILCYGPHAFAQRSQSATASNGFTSLYTNLNTQCRNAFRTVGEGQDMPLKCKGYGSYYIYIYYSAWASHINIQRVGKEDDYISLAMQALGYSDEKGRKIEWRMANGKPFAVIARISKYRERDDGGNPFDPSQKTGEALIVKGLKGYDIDFEVDASRPDANQRARELADAAYEKSRAGRPAHFLKPSSTNRRSKPVPLALRSIEDRSNRIRSDN